jgi:hypothetical protein
VQLCLGLDTQQDSGQVLLQVGYRLGVQGCAHYFVFV